MTFVAAVVGGAIGYGVGGTLTAGLIGAGVGSMFGGGSNQANAMQDAAGQQAAATQYAAQQQREMFNTLNEQNKPYREAGYGALTKIQNMLPQFTKTFTNADLNSNLAPNYEFMKQQGLGAVRQGLNVGGGGSNVNLGAVKFAENYAQNAYQQALENWRSQQGDIYNRLSNLAGLGQAAQSQQAQFGQNAASNIGQLAVAGANAQASGQIGAANAMSNTIGQLGNAGLMYALLG